MTAVQPTPISAFMILGIGGIGVGSWGSNMLERVMPHLAWFISMGRCLVHGEGKAHGLWAQSGTAFPGGECVSGVRRSQ